MAQLPETLTVRRRNHHSNPGVAWKTDKENRMTYSRGPTPMSSKSRVRGRVVSRPRSAPGYIRPASTSGRSSKLSSRFGTTVRNSNQTSLDEVTQYQVKVSVGIDHLRRKLEKLKETISALEIDIREEDKRKNIPVTMLVSNQKKIKKLENQLLRTRQERSDNENQINRLKQRVDRARMEKMSKLHTQREWAKDVEKKEQQLAALKTATQEVQDRQAQINFEMDDIHREAAQAINQYNDNVDNVQEKLQLTKSVIGESCLDINENLRPARETLNPKAYLNHRTNLTERVLDKRKSKFDLLQTSVQIASAKDVLEVQTNSIVNVAHQVDEVLARVGVKDVEAFIKVMNEEEERHFSVFTLINEMAREEDSLRNDQKVLLEQIEERQAELDAEQQNKTQKFEELKSTLERYKKMMKSHTQRYDEEMKLFKAIQEPFLSTFLKMGCGEGAGAALRAAGFNEQNAVDFLGPMEDRIDTFLQMWTLKNKEPAAKLVERMRMVTLQDDDEPDDFASHITPGTVSNISSPGGGHHANRRMSKFSDAWATPTHQYSKAGAQGGVKGSPSLQKPLLPSMADHSMEDDLTLTDTEVESVAGDKKYFRPIDTEALKMAMKSRVSPMKSRNDVQRSVANYRRASATMNGRSPPKRRPTFGRYNNVQPNNQNDENPSSNAIAMNGARPESSLM
mmetsp:Transcript_27678/g.35982  ORF Transcript_27678/g.35982 Transcript_27678/m.35982 type:complete len:680 (+) Transcript_27678:97-2136(+)